MPMRLTDEQRLLRTISEASWQRHVEQTLALAGFDLIYHTHDSRRSQAGFPDVVAIRLDDEMRFTIVVAELKREMERPTREQWRWLDYWAGIAGRVNGNVPKVKIITGVWCPSDAERITKLLTEEGSA